MSWGSLLLLLPQHLLSQQSSSQTLFQKNCAGCHGEDARGTAKAPGLAMNQRVAGQTPEQLSAFLAQGNIAGGMPSFADLSAADRVALAKYLRRLNLGIIVRPPVPTQPTRKITWGPPKPGDWLTYNGNVSANRYSPAQRDQHRECFLIEVEVDFPHSVLRPRNHAARSRRSLVCNGTEPGVRHRRAHRQYDLAVFASWQRRDGW